MTGAAPAAVTGAGSGAPAADRATIVAIACLEARRTLAAPWLWLGIGAGALAARDVVSVSFPAGGYRGVMGSFAIVAAALFVLGATVGGRDRLTGDPVASEAAVHADSRALGRLLGLLPAVGVAVLFAVGVFVVQRAEGGMRIADVPAGSTDAVYSLVEMSQPPLVFVVAASAGVALGRTRLHRIMSTIAGSVAVASMGLLYWAWQWTPAVWVTLVQTQPVERRLDVSFSPASAPASWMLSAPDRYETSWGRVLVHVPMASWHLVYLAGMTLVFCGLAVRRRHGRIAFGAGVFVVVAAVIAQVVVTPGDLAGV